MTPRVDIFFKIFCAKKFSITQRSFWGHFQKTYISTSVLPNFGQRLPKIQSRDINFCQFYDPPKPGVDRADDDFFGSKIAKNRLKTPKKRQNQIQGSPKVGENDVQSIFVTFMTPPNPGSIGPMMTFPGQKSPKMLENAKNETLVGSEVKENCYFIHI